MTALSRELNAALKAMELSFHVRLIGTFDDELIWAPADVEAVPWLDANYPDFDQFPVKQKDGTVGVLLRGGDHTGKSVSKAMRPLREGLIVSADMPITDLITQLSDNHYRLIIRGGLIDGLVTQSDLLKLPVRMLLFGLVNHLELCLRALVLDRVPEADLLNLLTPKRRKKVLNDLSKLSKARLEPNLLEFTNLSDVVDMLIKEEDLGLEFKKDMDSIRKLRNDVAHAKTYISSPSEVSEFANRFKRTRSWIERVTEMLRTTQ